MTTPLKQYKIETGRPEQPRFEGCKCSACLYIFWLEKQLTKAQRKLAKKGA